VQRIQLFKVTSTGGVAEVWLMGQRLLELRGGARGERRDV
jgi:hypothetical protein